MGLGESTTADHIKLFTVTGTVTSERRSSAITCWTEYARVFSPVMNREILIPMRGARSAKSVRSTYAGADGEWDEKSQTLIKVRLVCGDCYQEIKLRNVPSTEGTISVQ